MYRRRSEQMAIDGASGSLRRAGVRAGAPHSVAVQLALDERMGAESPACAAALLVAAMQSCSITAAPAQPVARPCKARRAVQAAAAGRWVHNTCTRLSYTSSRCPCPAGVVLAAAGWAGYLAVLLLAVLGGCAAPRVPACVGCRRCRAGAGRRPAAGPVPPPPASRSLPFCSCAACSPDCRLGLCAPACLCLPVPAGHPLPSCGLPPRSAALSSATPPRM